MLASIIDKILNTEKPIGDIIDFATRSLENGKLSLIYPGIFHDLMRTAVSEMRKPNGSNIFHQLLINKR